MKQPITPSHLPPMSPFEFKNGLLKLADADTIEMLPLLTQENILGLTRFFIMSNPAGLRRIRMSNDLRAGLRESAAK